LHLVAVCIAAVGILVLLADARLLIPHVT